MQIWIDADACPKPIKEILFRVSVRLSVPLILVANQSLAVPSSEFIRAIQVEAGFDVADNYIVNAASPGDLVITSDIPLAAEVIANNVHVLTSRGERYTKDNIAQRLTMRNFMEQMRSCGENTGGPPPFSNVDRQQFANALDRLLAKRGSLNR